MLETSKDLLYVLLGLSILLVAAFFSWVLYQMGRAIKGFNDIIDKGRAIATSIHDSVQEIKNKSSQGAAYLGLFIKGGLEILKHLQKRRVNKSKSNPSGH